MYRITQSAGAEVLNNMCVRQRRGCVAAYTMVLCWRFQNQRTSAVHSAIALQFERGIFLVCLTLQSSGQKKVPDCSHKTLSLHVRRRKIYHAKGIFTMCGHRAGLSGEMDYWSNGVVPACRRGRDERRREKGERRISGRRAG